MNTKWKVIISVMLLITTICTVFIVLVHRLNDDKLRAIIAGKKESAHLMAETLLNDFSQVYSDRIRTFTNPKVSPSRARMIQAFAERDREKLLAMSKPLLAVFKRNPHFASIGWVLPDNRNFLRIHAPEMYGDDVSKLRPDIAAVNRDHKQHSGFDAGISGLQYRVVQPVFYKGKYIGLVQFGLHASFIFDELQKGRSHAHTGLAVLNEESATVIECDVPKLVGRTHTIRARDVDIYKPMLAQLDWSKKQQDLVLHGEDHVILNILPANNFQNEQLGTFFVAMSIADELAEARKQLAFVLTISAAILVFSFLILYFSYGSLVEKIISLNKSLEKSNLELEDRVQERTIKLQESERQLHRAQKMEAIGMMASGVAHDLNNILSGVINYPELMLLKLPESSELRKPLTAIQESGKRAATVVEDLLTVARGAASAREPHDINVIIAEYLRSPEFLKLQTMHPGVVCTTQLEATHPVISCSPMHIKKTIMNLMTNGVEAADGSGEVAIATFNQQVTEGGSLKHKVEPGDYLCVTVRDNGPGIAAKDIDHIFEPFYTKKVMGQSGTGLGLAVVWNTMEDHEGRIFVESGAQGTSFHLYFPISNDDEAIPISHDMGAKLTGNGERILVVDDEPQLRDIAAQILQALGYTVDSVCSGELAIKFVIEQPVDLLVIDMLMEPGMNGRQTFAEIRAINPEQRAIIASGYSDSDDVKEALRLGAGGFIKKPYSMAKLGRAVKDALKG
ncbi:MAG: response regulator [Thermodesulfobacteriota bacterium]